MTRRLVQCWVIALSLTVPTFGVSSAVSAAARASSVAPDQLFGVSCTATACQDVGQTGYGQQGYVARSLSEGATWTSEQLPTSVSNLVSISCPTRLACFAVGTEGPHRALVISTTSGGATWMVRLVPANVGTPQAIACPTSTLCEWFANRPGGAIVLRTSDGGSRWSAHSLPGSVARVADLSCSSAMVCEGIGSQSASRSVDVRTINGGLSWSATLLPSDVTSANAIACPAASTCFALGKSKSLGGIILKSSNGGTTWKYSAVNGTGGVISCASITRCVGMALGPTSLLVLRTSNGGSSWQTSNLPNDVTALSHISCATSMHCVVVGTDAPMETHVEVGATARTRDGGVTWSRFR